MKDSTPLKENTLNVTEIFHSLQGEGPWLGIPATFLRLGGCVEPYCPWCDTPYALEESTRMSPRDILDALEGYPGRQVVVTGGEPFLQWDHGLADLHASLVLRGYRIQYETSGKVPFPLMPDALIVCSPKCIDGTWRFDPANRGRADYYKFVAHDPGSLEAMEGFIGLYALPKERVYVMPLGTTREEQLRHMEPLFCFCRDHGYRMTPRLHVLTFDSRRGV